MATAFSSSSSSSSADQLEGPVAGEIRSKLTQAFKPSELEVHNDSWKHAGHAAMKGVQGNETHFRVRIVSGEFQGKGLLERHRMVYGVLGQELRQGLHALQLTTKTADE
ncbi:BolA domain UV induced protein Uvi31 [Sorochytrium milnesiophthora]